MMAKPSTVMMISSRLHGGGRVLAGALALAAFAAAPAFAAARAPVPPASAAVSAPTPPAFGISAVGSAGSIHIDGGAGDVLHGAVLLRNASRRPITVIVQRADIANAANGNANYLTAHPAGTGLWLRLSAGRVRLAPHGVRKVDYTVSIPAGTAGGKHYAGIVAFNAADLAHASARGKSQGHSLVFYRINRQALPLTIRLPGPLSRGLSLQSVKLSVGSAGAGLVLGLRPGGTELTNATQVNLHVLRGGRKVLASAAGLGQLFPGSALDYRIPWPGTPTAGTYRVVGTIRPQGSPVIRIDQSVSFTPAKAAQLKRLTPPAPGAPSSGTPGWVWIALGAAAALMLALALAVAKLARRPKSLA